MHMSAQNTAPTRQAGWPASFLVPGPLSAACAARERRCGALPEKWAHFSGIATGLIGGWSAIGPPKIRCCDVCCPNLIQSM